MTASPTIPSTVARIRTGPPTLTPVTSPLPDTEATEASVDDQLTARPDTTMPLEVLGVALSWMVRPWMISLRSGVTSTRATTSTVVTPPSEEQLRAASAAERASAV